jgi:hypothetical protein
MLLIPTNSFAANLLSVSYSMLMDKTSPKLQEGLMISYDMEKKKTRFSIGVHSTSFDKTQKELSPIGLEFDLQGVLASLPLEANIDLADVQYSVTNKTSITSIMLFGDYNYFTKKAWFGEKKIDPRNTHGISLFAGGGVRYSLTTSSNTYNLFIDEEYFDSIKNPLAGSKSSGLKFFLEHTIEYRFSMMHISLLTAISIPEVDRSFASLQLGITL